MAREPHLRDYLTATKSRNSFVPRRTARATLAAMILIAYRHGLRASEVTNLRVSDVDLRNATIYCRRAKGSRSSYPSNEVERVRTLERFLRKRH